MTRKEYEKWRQRTACGLIFSTYALKYESEIDNVAETVDNPFDVGNVVVRNENKKNFSTS